MVYKKITKDELEVFLRKHKLWLENDLDGECANLRGANLRGANLRGADLLGADLYNTNLCGANLCGANLYNADLRGANLYNTNLLGANLYNTNLCGANLCGANLYNADLRGANLYNTNLCGANLYNADLRGTNLYDAYLCGADLRGADLCGANLCGADLCGANNITYPIACPEKGSFTAFKKVPGYIVELEIPADALRSSATSRKCRASKARVVSITNMDGTDAGIISAASSYDSSFIYTVGETVEVPNFNPDRWIECAPGIHFFITRQEAVDYYL